MSGPEPPFPTSLCHRCQHRRLVSTTRGSVFLQCLEPSLPKYLPQPVTACGHFAPNVAPGDQQR